MITIASEDLTPATWTPDMRNTAPVWVVNYTSAPGTLPNPDTAHAVHVFPYSVERFAESVRSVAFSLIDMMTSALEDSIDSLDGDESDESTGDAGFLELLRVSGDSYGEVAAEIARGVAESVRTGTEFGYRVALGTGETVYFFAAPASEPGVVCSEYESNGYCSTDTDWCGTGDIDPSRIEDGATIVRSTPHGPVGYVVAIEPDYDPTNPRVEDYRASTWTFAGADDEIPGTSPLAGRWDYLLERHSAGTAYEMIRLYARLFDIATVPLWRSGYDGSVRTGAPGSHQRRALSVKDSPGFARFDRVHGEPDGFAIIAPEDLARTGAELPRLDTEPGSVLSAPFDPGAVRAFVEEDVTVYNQWVTGDIYGYSVERVALEPSGDWESEGPGVESVHGFYGTDYETSGLAESVTNAIECDAKKYVPPVESPTFRAGSVTVQIFTGDDGATVVQIDTTPNTTLPVGRVRINLNDGAVFDANPDTGEEFELS